MEKRLFTLILFFLPALAFSQTKSEYPKTVYCEIVGSGKLMSSKIKISVDFGQNRKTMDGSYNFTLVDENGKALNFSSMIGALNHMAKLGWKFEQAYVVTDDLLKQNVYHYLLSKEIKEGEDIGYGLHTRKDYNSEKKSYEEDKEDLEPNSGKKKRNKPRKVVDDIYR